MIYLLLFAGLFMGWSLGTVDSASAFSTAVATRVVKYRTAVIIIAVFVVVGAFISGQTNITRVAELATSNKVLFSPADVQDAIENHTVALLQTKAAIKAAIIYASAGLTVFIMSYLKFPVSSNQSITGAIIGWGLFYADYSNPEILNLNLTQIGRFALTWLLNPLCACAISFGLVWLVHLFVEARLETLSGYDKIITWGYLLAGVFASYSIGLNSSANMMALYYDASFAETGVVANLITNPRMAATIGEEVGGTVGYQLRMSVGFQSKHGFLCLQRVCFHACLLMIRSLQMSEQLFLMNFMREAYMQILD